MNINDAYNHKNKTTINIQDIFELKYLGQYLFPLPAYLNINWDKLKQLNIYDAYKFNNNLNTLFTLEFDKVPFILVVHNHTSTQITAYCTNESYYNIMIKHFMLFSETDNCNFLSDLNTEIIPSSLVK